MQTLKIFERILTTLFHFVWSTAEKFVVNRSPSLGYRCANHSGCIPWDSGKLVKHGHNNNANTVFCGKDAYYNASFAN